MLKITRDGRDLTELELNVFEQIFKEHPVLPELFEWMDQHPWWPDYSTPEQSQQVAKPTEAVK
jgi:hypothetical protein